MSNKWHYSGDINMLDYGGTFVRHIADRRYHAVRFENMEDLGCRETPDQPKYVGSLVEVNLDEVDERTVKLSCGTEVEDYDDLELAFMAVSYGSYAPLEEEGGNNGHEIVRALKRASREIESDAARHEALMNRPVNALGSTAREFARGDFQPAIDRGLKDGSQTAVVMARVMRPRHVSSVAAMNESGITHEVSIDHSLTGSDDPIAFMFGFGQGVRGTKMEKARGLAPEYVRGYEEGAKARESGVMPPYVIQSKW